MNIIKLNHLFSKRILDLIESREWTEESLQATCPPGVFLEGKDLGRATAVVTNDITYPCRYVNCYLFYKREGCPSIDEYRDYIVGGNLEELFTNSKGKYDKVMFSDCFHDIGRIYMGNLI